MFIITLNPCFNLDLLRFLLSLKNTFFEDQIYEKTKEGVRRKEMRILLCSSTEDTKSDWNKRDTRNDTIRNKRMVRLHLSPLSPNKRPSTAEPSGFQQTGFVRSYNRI